MPLNSTPLTKSDMVKADSTKVKAFWDWFKVNQERLYGFITGLRTRADALKGDELLNAILAEVIEALHKIDERLTFEFSLTRGGIAGFTISADGNLDVFPTVMQIVAEAPQLENWKVICFRQARDIEMPFHAVGIGIKADDIWFSFSQHNNLTDLHVFVRNLSLYNRREILPVIALFIDAAIGEYAATIGIGAIEFSTLPDDPIAHGLLPLGKLKEIVIIRPN